MHIRPVKTRRDQQAFLELTFRHYRGDPNFVPPLRSELRGQFDPVKNPFLQHCQTQLFLLEDGKGKPIGRVAAFIDKLANDHWGEPVGLFGYFESPDHAEAAGMLLEASASWLRERGMTVMRGPWSFVSQEWGMVLEGFEPPPVVMSPYNPPYYNDLVTAYGMRKVKDLLVYAVDARNGYRIPDRILTLTDLVAGRYGIRVRQIDMVHFDREVQTIINLSNQSLSNNWGFSPVTEAEVRAMARDLKPIIQPKGVVFAEDSKGRPVGFAIAIPDVNHIIKPMRGSLLPFGWIKLLAQLPRLKRYRMFALGVVPEYHRKAIDSLIYRHLYETCYSPDLFMEINYVLEDKAPMNNAIQKLGATLTRRYRVYQIDL